MWKSAQLTTTVENSLSLRNCIQCWPISVIHKLSCSNTGSCLLFKAFTCKWAFLDTLMHWSAELNTNSLLLIWRFFVCSFYLDYRLSTFTGASSVSVHSEMFDVFKNSDFRSVVILLYDQLGQLAILSQNPSIHHPWAQCYSKSSFVWSSWHFFPVLSVVSIDYRPQV